MHDLLELSDNGLRAIHGLFVFNSCSVSAFEPVPLRFVIIKLKTRTSRLFTNATRVAYVKSEGDWLWLNYNYKA